MIRFFLRPNKDRKSLNAFDYKLVKHAQSRSFPVPAQLKYLFHFLSKREKTVFLSSFALAIVGLMLLSGVFIQKHLELLPAEGGEYSEAMVGQPKLINPLFASVNDVDQDISALVYPGLFRFSGRVLLPDLAESYSVSTDTKTYFIKIKSGIKFADGKPLTADDVIYTFDLIQNRETASPLSAAFRDVKIERTDDLGVNFILKEPFAPFLENLTIGILPEHIWSEVSPNSIRLAKNNLQPLGAGPWQFSKVIKDSTGRVDTLILARNEHYFGNKPYFQTIRFKFFDEYGSAEEAVKSQNVDAISFLPGNGVAKFKNSKLNFFDLSLPEYTALFFNPTGAPDLKDRDLRIALTKAINKTYITDILLKDRAFAIDSPFLPGNVGFSADIKKIGFNPEEANQLLDKKWTRLQPEEYFKLRETTLLKELSREKPSSTEAVQKQDAENISALIRSEMDADQTFFRKDKDNNILEITITTGDSEDYGKVAEEIAKYWKAVGVRTTVEKLPSGRLLREPIKNRSYDALLYSEVTGNDPDPYPFWHSSQTESPGLNLAAFSDRNADKLLEDGRAASSTDARTQNYLKFQNILTDEAPAVFLYSPIHIMAVNREIKGVEMLPLNNPSDRYANFDKWYLKTRIHWK